MDKFEAQLKTYLKKSGINSYKMYNVPEGIPDFCSIMSNGPVLIEVKGSVRSINIRPSMFSIKQLNFLISKPRSFVAFKSAKTNGWVFYKVIPYFNKYAFSPVSFENNMLIER